MLNTMGEIARHKKWDSDHKSASNTHEIILGSQKLSLKGAVVRECVILYIAIIRGRQPWVVRSVISSHLVILKLKYIL